MNNISLPMASMDIPAVSEDAKKITALVRESGKVVGYRLSDGRTLDKANAIQLAKQGGIRGVGVSTRNGSEYLKSLPDGNDSNNLISLPSVQQ